MKTRVVGGVLLAVLCCLQAFGQVGVWKNYTSMQEVRSIARAGSTYWASTSGGLYSWMEGSDSYTKLTSAEGLQSTDLTAVAVDNNGDIWTGSSLGNINVYTPSTGTWRYILDIANASATNKRINSLQVVGDSVLICHSFGLSVFRISKFQFGDTYKQFGGLTGNVVVSVQSAAIFDGKIWTTVSDGQITNRVASANLSNPNLLPPESWALQSISTPLNIPTNLAMFNNRLYVGTSTGLFVLSDTSAAWTAVGALSGRNVTGLKASAGMLAIAETTNVVDTLNLQNAVGQFGATVPSAVSSITLNASNTPVVGTSTLGIMTLQNTWISHFPNGPASNQFFSIAVDLDGNVWGASGINGGGKGFYRLSAAGKTWKSFNRQNSPLPTDDYYRVSVGCNGDVWIGSWLRGVALMPRGADHVDTTKIYGRNVGMSGILEDSTLVVVGPAICDLTGNTWMSVMKVRDKHPLAIRKPDGTWKTLGVYINGTPQIYLSERDVTRALLVDGTNSIWATAVFDGNKGLVSLCNRGSLSDSIACLFLNSNNGLPSDIINCIAIDQQNNIWVGTDNGIGIILDPSNPTRTGGIASYKPLPGLFVNAIAVDPLGQKWIASNQGVVLLSSDGTQTLAQYNVLTTSGKTISDQVKDVAVDPATGTVYFATLNGLASLSTTSVQPNSDFGKITVSPNPYRIPNAIPLTIDGLVENSVIKILTLDGHLIREVASPGGRIGFWDGKDSNGKDVASGIYIIVAYSTSQTDKVGTGKVAVLRR